MLTTTADSIIAVACSQAGHVLVSHDKDFKEISKRLQITQGQYRKLLHRIHLRCQEPSDVVRLKEAMSLIEAEWQLIKPDRPMVIEINDVSIRITRWRPLTSAADSRKLALARRSRMLLERLRAVGLGPGYW